MTGFPEIITHNYDPLRGPFRNICDSSEAKAEAILSEIRKSGKRHVSRSYLKRRLAVEQWLRSECKKKLRSATLVRPIYFFLGDFADGQDASRPKSIVMQLAAFSADTLTFTFPDSMVSLPIAKRNDLRAHKKEYHGRVFNLDEIKEIVARWGMPDKNDSSIRYDRFIEVQVWNDAPLQRFLNKENLARETTQDPRKA